ncbi:MAG: hypothetical protein ACRDJ9_21020 [Dehalococcoidia bacterium]
MFATAALMAVVAVFLVAAGAVFVSWDGENATILGWILIGWGAGGLGSALIVAIRAWRR